MGIVQTSSVRFGDLNQCGIVVNVDDDTRMTLKFMELECSSTPPSETTPVTTCSINSKVTKTKAARQSRSPVVSAISSRLAAPSAAAAATSAGADEASRVTVVRPGKRTVTQLFLADWR